MAGSLGLAAAAAAGGAAIAAGLSGGNLGQILRSAAVAGLTAAAFFEVGSATNAIAGVDPTAAHIQPQFGTDAFAFNVAGHALVGCASATASGGSCESGALSGAVTAGAGPFINNQNQVASLVQNAVLGGVASVAGGGKFANGAITGAFGYLFNQRGGRGIEIEQRPLEEELREELDPNVRGGLYYGTSLPAPYYPHYPPNNDFAGRTSVEFIPSGTILIRYGFETGSFLTLPGTTPNQISLPPNTSLEPTAYEVVRPVLVESGTAAPWAGFGYGGGVQYRNPVSVGELVNQGILRRVP